MNWNRAGTKLKGLFMSDAMLFKFQAPVGQISLYESGVIAGADCRKREGKRGGKGEKRHRKFENGCRLRI